MSNCTNIGGIGNTYGGLVVKTEYGKYYWCIQECSFSDDFWEEITEELYNQLLVHNKQNNL